MLIDASRLFPPQSKVVKGLATPRSFPVGLGRWYFGLLTRRFAVTYTQLRPLVESLQRHKSENTEAILSSLYALSHDARLSTGG